MRNRIIRFLFNKLYCEKCYNDRKKKGICSFNECYGKIDETKKTPMLHDACIYCQYLIICPIKRGC